MRRHLLATFFAVASVFLLACASTAQDRSIANFTKSLTDFNAAEPVVVENNFDDDEEELKDLARLTIVRFTSKTAQKDDPKTFARVVLMVFDYQTEASAMAVLRAIPENAEDEMRKEPELNFVVGSKFYKLIGACMLGDRWDPITTKLTDAIFGKGKSPDHSVSIACGGTVTLNGDLTLLNGKS